MKGILALVGSAVLLTAQPAIAQQAPPSMVSSASASSATGINAAVRPRPRPVRQAPRLAAIQPGNDVALPPAAPPPVQVRRSRGELAPVPNRDIEAPTNPQYSMQAKLMPEVFRQQMPGRGMTATGLSDQREERVYAPAPGARLTLPFFTR